MSNPYTNDNESLPVPGVDPTASPTVSIALNSAWIPYLIGALDRWRNASYWQGTAAEIDECLQQVDRLIGLLTDVV